MKPPLSLFVALTKISSQDCLQCSIMLWSMLGSLLCDTSISHRPSLTDEIDQSQTQSDYGDRQFSHRPSLTVVIDRSVTDPV